MDRRIYVIKNFFLATIVLGIKQKFDSSKVILTLCCTHSNSLTGKISDFINRN